MFTGARSVTQGSLSVSVRWDVFSVITQLLVEAMPSR
jgi:hypothetical protein